MALARVILKHVKHGVSTPAAAAVAFGSSNLCERGLIGNQQKQGWGFDHVIVRRFSEAAASDKPSSEERTEGREVAVSEAGKKSKLFSRKHNRRGLWRNRGRDFVPSIYDFLPSGPGSALLQATENMNKLFENLSPSRLMGRVKEHDECYKLRYLMPGLAKDDVKITIENGVLVIKGEHKEEEEEGSDDEYWSSRSYGYYNTSILLPDDAKVDEIKAEMKDGMLQITIPRIEKPKQDVKEVQIQSCVQVSI